LVVDLCLGDRREHNNLIALAQETQLVGHQHPCLPPHQSQNALVEHSCAHGRIERREGVVQNHDRLVGIHRACKTHALLLLLDEREGGREGVMYSKGLVRRLVGNICGEEEEED
jgi:hypothetical protein